MNGISDLVKQKTKKTLREHPLPPPLGEHSQKPENRLSLDTDAAGNLISDFSAPETVK